MAAKPVRAPLEPLGRRQASANLASVVSREAPSQLFSRRLLGWHAQHGRHNLPWLASRDPYRVWVSEIMLQQTQVATVIPYYDRFVARFPSVQVLAAAPSEEVMRCWAGLGYYARARNLHRCAQVIVEAYAGLFPRTSVQLAALPGIGASTAAAIAAFCYDERAAILDGNVKRVLARQFGIDGYPGVAAVHQQLSGLAVELLPDSESMPSYTQALMDLGATVCTRTKPRCDLCPLAESCVALRDRRVDELPTRQPPKRARERAMHFLLVECAGAVLLEQRPPSGIWGGLLAPPQFDSKPDADSALARIAPEAVAQVLATRRHAFTHFTLVFTPLHVRIERATRIAGELALRWLPFSQIDAAPLPAPIRSLLRELASRSAEFSPFPG